MLLLDRVFRNAPFTTEICMKQSYNVVNTEHHWPRCTKISWLCQINKRNKVLTFNVTVTNYPFLFLVTRQSTLVAFCPKILGLRWGSMKAVSHSVNADGVEILLGGGGVTSTLHVITEVVWTFCTEKWWGVKNLVYITFAPLHPLCSPLPFAPLCPLHFPSPPL